MKIEVFSDVISRLGESPVYDSKFNRLIWTDIYGKRWLESNLSTRATRIHKVSGMVSAVALKKNGGLFGAVEEGFAELNEQGDYRTTHSFLDESKRMNDGKVDPLGRMWAGVVSRQFSPGVGELIRVNHDGSITKILKNLTLPNGMCWDVERSRFYLVDSLQYVVWVFDFELSSGEILKRRIFQTFRKSEGIPDGLSISEEGLVLVAMWGGSQVIVLNTKGERAFSVQLPVKHPTSCAFGGKEFGTLFITSAIEDSNSQGDYLDGKVLQVEDLGLRGLGEYSLTV